MKEKFFSFFRDYWKKLILIAVLAAGCWVFNNLEFPRIDAFIRDSLQYLNSTKNINKSLVTVNIDFPDNKFKPPYTLENLKILIDKLQQSKPRHILLMIEPLDLTSDKLEKKAIFDYFLSQKNLFLNAFIARDELTTFQKDDLFKNYPHFFKFNLSSDQLSGSQDNKNRREALYINGRGPAIIINSLKELGFTPKDYLFFKYHFKYWDTTQAYIKNFKLGTFGNIQTSDIIAGKIDPSLFAEKVIIIGNHSQFSYLALPSVFKLLDAGYGEKNIRESLMPLQEMVAHLINFYTTGDYIKLIGYPDFIFVIFLILSFLILSNISFERKFFILISLIPIIIAIEILVYVISSFYFDISKSLAFLVFIEYLAVPIIMLLFFKSQEQKKLNEINDARIDSLLLVSEKLAHDIRSPLSAINLILSQVKIENPEYSEIIKNSLKRIDDIAENLLNKHKVTTDKKENIFETINLKKIIEPLVDEKKLIDPRIKYSFINFNENEMLVLGHKLELERIISNIIDNSIFALKNKESNREISFELTPNKNLLCLNIKDNGIGIPSGVLTLLGKEKVTTKTLEKGNGIGLLHAKRVIERMNGKFEIVSKENEYTVVSISLNISNYIDTKD